jgi:nucleoid-associated protein YgaU
MRHLVAFVLLLLIGGGVGWSLYERQRDSAMPPAGDAADVAPSDPTDARQPPPDVAMPTEEEAQDERSAPPQQTVGDNPAEAGAKSDAAPERPASPPRDTAQATGPTPQPVAPPEPAGRQPKMSYGSDMARAEPEEGSAQAVEERWRQLRSLSLGTIRRALSPFLGHSSEPAPKAAPTEPDTRGAERTLAEVKGDPQTAPEPSVIKPSFDIVRISRDGQAVIAGRAEPGAEVEIRVGERVIDTVVSTRRGSWVSMPLEPIKESDRELSLAARVEGRPLLRSDQVVVLALPDGQTQQQPDLAASRPAISKPDAASGTSGGAAAVSRVAAEPGPRDPVAVLMRKDDAARGRVLQAPGRISGGGELALLVLDYDDRGRVRLSGEGPPGAPVRLYVNNQPAGEFSVAQDGTWRATLHERLEPGAYTLRLDQLDDGGKPVARLETPFMRASHPPAAGEAQVDYVIVQPGNSLWRIARRLFGSGFKYVHLFEANSGQIRDPDLIYPGQVFEVPAAISAQG